MNNELGRIRKEMFLVYLKVLSWNLPGGTEEDNEKVRLADLGAEVRIRDLPSMKECKPVDRSCYCMQNIRSWWQSQSSEMSEKLSDIRRTRKFATMFTSLPLDPILNQLNPIYTLTLFI
jgi:hypothetical protein